MTSIYSSFIENIYIKTCWHEENCFKRNFGTYQNGIQDTSRCKDGEFVSTNMSSLTECFISVDCVLAAGTGAIKKLQVRRKDGEVRAGNGGWLLTHGDRWHSYITRSAMAWC